jgi:hypothetical protein
MTFAPLTLKALGAYWNAQGGVNLGIVGDTAHAQLGVSYHLGKSQLRSDAYSIQTARDKAGLTEAASAIDLGRLDGSLTQLRKFSDWLARRCVKNQPGTFDVREVIYSPDGKMVLGYKDGVDFLIPGFGDDSHLTHTHISFYRDSEFRDKLALFRPYFELPDTGADMATGFDFRPDTRLGTVTVNGKDHWYRDIAGVMQGPINPDTFGTHVALGPVDLVPPIPGGPAGADRTTGVVIGKRSAHMLWADVIFTPAHTHARSTDT